MTTTYRITFDRIGRNHHPEPFTVAARNADDLAAHIWRHVRPKLGSKDVDVLVDLERGRADIFCGYRNGGGGRIEVAPS